MEIRGNLATVFAEGCRGHLGKELIQKFDLSQGKDPQHYGKASRNLGIDHQCKEGLVVHTNGWPLPNDTPGGSYMYAENNQVLLGIVIHLTKNPH